jgi:hypothetical protein
VSPNNVIKSPGVDALVAFTRTERFFFEASRFSFSANHFGGLPSVNFMAAWQPRFLQVTDEIASGLLYSVPHFEHFHNCTLAISPPWGYHSMSI